MQQITEQSRQIPIVHQSDVVVCGAGPAGVAAALAGARAGARTILIESRGCLGGIWTAGLLTWILDKDNKTGIMQEILHRLDERGARNQSNAYDPEAMKLVLERMCLEDGVHVRLHTQIVSAVVERDRLQAVITESKSGREAWSGKCFIDCTGDGDLAARARCAFSMGDPQTGRTQPMTLMALVSGVDYQTLNDRGLIRGGAVNHRQAKDKLRAEMERCGVSPSYSDPTLFPIRDGLYGLMANHQYGVLGTSADDLTRATMEARSEINRIVDALRHAGGIWENLRLIATAEHIGVREGRRIAGRYEVSADDVANGARFSDAVCRVTFGFDVHALNPAITKGVDHSHKRGAQHYDIPLRALISRDLGNLLMAGRCISGDFLAHSSYRVTGNAVAMGQAAGACAAVAVREDLDPHEVTIQQVLAELPPEVPAGAR